MKERRLDPEKYYVYFYNDYGHNFLQLPDDFGKELHKMELFREMEPNIYYGEKTIAKNKEFEEQEARMEELKKKEEKKLEELKKKYVKE